MNPQFPAPAPVCDDISEKNDQYQRAKDEQRPFLAVVDDEDLPGWQAIYVMDTTGEGRRNWYYLNEEGVKLVEERRSAAQERVQHESWVSKCSETRGELHGLSKDDAKYLADRFADIVWNTDYWREVTPREIFQENFS